MNERRRFLQVIGGGAVAMGVGCGAGNVQTGSTGTGGSGAGGSGAGGNGAGGMSGTGGSTASSSSGGATCEMNPTGLKVGKPSDYAMNGLHIVTNQGVLIGRDAGGLYALTALCTHQLCDMAAVDSQGPFGQIQGKDIVCLCHGSTFSPTGNVVTGPAAKPLRAFALALGCDGFLYVTKSKVVPNSTRLQA